LLDHLDHSAQLPGVVWRKISSVIIGVAAVAAIVFLVMPSKPPADQPPPPPAVELAGEPLDLAGDPVADALDLVRRYARRDLTLVLPDGTKRELQPARLGAEIDRARLAELVKDVLNEKSALMSAYRDREEPAGALVLPIPIRVDAENAIAALVRVKDTVDRPATDAVVNVESRELEPDTPGFRLDVYGTLAAVDAALRSGKAEAHALGETIQPRVKASQLGNVKFDHVLGWFETRYSPSAKYRARTYNLRQAASKLDGSVLLPGETFDFNDTVGPRDEANGYRVAPVIAQGELVDGIGGGTCQISGTLHGAVFFAGLEIESRIPHTRPSTYIKLGLDAAVAFPTLNFKMKNTFDFPIVLHQTVKGGVVRAEVLGPKRTNTVTFFRRIDNVEPFEVEERETDKLPKGTVVLSQRGIPGFKATVYRIVREGAYAVRTKTFNHYPPTTQIVKVGTGSSDAKKGKDVGSLEYTADEYLVLTQAPRKNRNKDEFIEKRVAGITGRWGWQKREGLPVFEREEEESD
jgi:vancomycin resistance protein YoaR